MKFVYLILYLWHSAEAGRDALGGPSLVVVPMPSLIVCEKVGGAAKQFADERRHRSLYGEAPLLQGRPADFRCIEVDDKPTPTPPKCSP